MLDSIAIRRAVMFASGSRGMCDAVWWRSRLLLRTSMFDVVVLNILAVIVLVGAIFSFFESRMCKTLLQSDAQ